MNIVPYSQEIDRYLPASEVIDFESKGILALSDDLAMNAKNKIEYIKLAYEYVRDHISHSADIDHDAVTCAASQVLQEGHGICFAKSNLFAALLRCKSIPAGFCYQKLILDDDTAPYLILHGLNGVYIEELHRWIRLDTRGNKPGVNAQFSLTEEKLAFPVRAEKGEEDILTVYPAPDKNVLSALKQYQTRSELWDNLPRQLAYRK